MGGGVMKKVLFLSVLLFSIDSFGAEAAGESLERIVKEMEKCKQDQFTEVRILFNKFMNECCKVEGSPGSWNPFNWK